uniref:G_PROTEIN_RECEP_F1_2 domain-containing protein n=1 Tax=Heterorhabditis bacteriophora TaxID=37862 RepID=A0A1I7X4X9_HETBA
MLFLLMLITFNRLIALVFSNKYNLIFNKRNVKIIYFCNFLVFIIPWLVKLSPFSTYSFSIDRLAWHYSDTDTEILMVLSHFFGNYMILVQVVFSVLGYTVIGCKLFIMRSSKLKFNEVVITLQHFIISFVFMCGFFYWEFLDGDYSEESIIMNLISNLIWIIINGLNPIIYFLINRRLRRAVFNFMSKKSVHSTLNSTAVLVANVDHSRKSTKLILLLPIFSTYFILPVDSYEVSPDCSNTQCNYGKGCVIRNNKPICVPINKENNCEKTQCGAGEECMYEEVVCIRAPCYPIPKCVGGGPEETPHETEPEVISSYGQPIKAEARIAAETITVRINKPKDPETKGSPLTFKGHPTLSCANVLCAIETPRCIETPAGPKCVAVKNCDQVKCGYNKKCVHDNLAQDATCVPVKKTDVKTVTKVLNAFLLKSAQISLVVKEKREISKISVHVIKINNIKRGFSFVSVDIDASTENVFRHVK